MAKGDHSRSENKSDEQQQQAQGYLSQTQGQLGNQYGNMYNNYMGQNAPTFGNVNNWGSTTPNYSMYSNPFAGNQSGTTVGNNPFGSPGGMGGGQDYQSIFNSILPGATITPQQLEAAAPQLAQYGIQVHKNAEGIAGKIVLPNGQIVDVMQNSGMGGGPKQWNIGMGGGGGGFPGMGGIPGMNVGDYRSILGMYGDTFGMLKGQYAPFLGAASSMANTGGLSEADKANLRARAISPIRSVYSQGLQDVERQRALQGGYSPGFTTAMGRFNRQMGQQTSDATTNAEAAIAELVQRGKLGGLSAWGSGLSGEASGLGGMLGGMSGLYGASPGLTGTLGNQMLAASGQQLTAAELQNQLGLGLIQGQNQIGANVPGNTASTLANIKTGMGLVPGLGGGIYPWLNDKFGGGGYGPAGAPPTSYGYG